MRLSWRNRILAFVTGEVPAPFSPVLDDSAQAYNSMTLEKWRDSSEHIQWASEQMKTRKFRDMIGVLQNAWLRINPDTLDPVKSSFFLGQLVGMKLQVQFILMMSNPPKEAQPDIPADYSEPETTDENV